MSNEEVLNEFTEITGAGQSVAQQYLARNEYNIESALNDFYNTENIQPGGRKEPQPSKAPNKRPSPRPQGSVFRSFSDLQRGVTSGNDEDDNDMNFFTGGQKSGLAVEDPNKPKNSRTLVDDLLEKAQKEAGEPDWRDDPQEDNPHGKAKIFKGTGHSLGSVENAVDSKTIADPTEAQHFKKPEKVTRNITFWKEGFSVDDGKLYKYDDPENQEYLKQLNMGRAPLSLLNVQMFQDVDVNVIKKLEESYHDHAKSKPRVYGFEGTGNRLGSPVPGDPTTVEEALALYGEGEKVQGDTEQTGSAVQQEATKPQGDTSIRILLASGAKVNQRFNSTDNVDEIYKVVESQSDNSRPWHLVTSFPTQPLDDKKSKTIAEAGLKNSVVIQKWL